MKEASYARQRRRGIKRKLKLVELKGGCCEICGYDKNLAVLTFHHTDLKTKKFNVGGQAAESLRKGTLFKEKRDKRRKSVDDMIQRLYGPKIKPKPKPKKPLKKVLGDKIKPTLKKKPINPKTRKPKGFGFKGPQGGGKLTRE